MIIVMERTATKENVQRAVNLLEEHGFRVIVHEGDVHTCIDALGDKTTLTPGRVSALDGVKEVKVIREPFRLASRDRKSEDTVIEFSNGVKIGGKNRPVFIVGPCSVDSDYAGLLQVATAAKEMGCEFLRGGAFKPRTSPYDFQGLEEEALKMMAKAKEETGLLLVTEVMDSQDLPMISDYVDVVQIGARNMQNFKLLKAVGKANIPVVLKRGPANTIREFLLAAEHIMYNGNEQVILCERGIRTFDDKYTRNTLDLTAVPVIKKLSHLPIIVDPSHATGQRYLIEPMSKAALVVGADGIMMEVHHDPENALSDGKQSLPIPMFKDVIKRLSTLRDQLEYDKTCLSANVK
ncbi:MAG: 3-deoxy-7-phosphoheptulonate synthase [Clostridiaceae bacterium]|jgi:3-deoxy-7-phosphoheptulonate synthase|nr:3-deoxy-7-phosphoheptulonate synthase [Clostridiaceae bacterium]